MISGIQDAYYRQALNPSDDEILIRVAEDIGLNQKQFAKDLNSAETRQSLADEIRFARSIGGDSFPSLILQSPGAEVTDTQLLMLSYTDTDKILHQL